MIDLVNAEISFIYSTNEKENIQDCLKILFSTPVGTVPFDRDFGIDLSILDKPVNIAKGLLAVEIIKKVKKYETRVEVKGVTFENDAKNGKISPKVVVEVVT